MNCCEKKENFGIVGRKNSKKVPWILNNGKSENWDRVNFKKI